MDGSRIDFLWAEMKYNLVTRAHQFSSFVVLIGSMAGPRGSDPKDAIVLQNKDEVVIPLL
jgi:hypothetical protein